MNKLEFDKGKMIKTLRNYNSTLECLKIAEINCRLAQEKIIIEQDNLLNPENSPLLFYFYYEKDLNFIDPNNNYINYFYDFRTERISTTTSNYKPLNSYSHAIDVSKYFIINEANANVFEEIRLKLNDFVNHLISKYNPDDWDTLVILVKNGIEAGEFELINKAHKLTK